MYRHPSRTACNNSTNLRTSLYQGASLQLRAVLRDTITRPLCPSRPAGSLPAVSPSARPDYSYCCICELDHQLSPEAFSSGSMGSYRVKEIPHYRNPVHTYGLNRLNLAARSLPTYLRDIRQRSIPPVGVSRIRICHQFG